MDGSQVRQVLARNIKSFREHRVWSQADLASHADLSIPFLSEIERGNKWPFPDTLAKLAKALKVPIHELFREDPSNSERSFTAMVVKELLTAQKAAADNVSKQYLG